MEPLYVRNTLKHIWEPATVLNRPDPLQNPRSYLIDLQGKVFRRTREHIRPRSIKNQTDPDDIDPKIYVTPPKLDYRPELGTDNQASSIRGKIN